MRYKTCQWISGNPTSSEDCKCGEPAQDDQPYCIEHFELAYQKARPRSRAPHLALPGGRNRKIAKSPPVHVVT